MDFNEMLQSWWGKAILIFVAVLVFNFISKRLLKNLRERFERQKRHLQADFVHSLYLPLSWYAWFFALVAVFHLIASHIYIPFPDMLRNMILAIGLVLAAAWFLMRWKKNIIKHMHLRSRSKEIAIDQGKIGAIDKILTLAIIFFAILTVLEVTDRSLTTLIAFGGIGGLALAFASQEIIANFFGGFMIYLTQPFTIGDWILLPDRSTEGHVEEIGWYMTLVNSLDKRPIHIPNSMFSKLIVITPSRMSHRQIKETIGVRYKDIKHIKAIVDDIRQMLQKHPDIDKGQAIIVNFHSFGQYSLDILLITFTRATAMGEFTKVKEDVLLKIAAILAKHHAELAFPTQSIELLNP